MRAAIIQRESAKLVRDALLSFHMAKLVLSVTGIVSNDRTWTYDDSTSEDKSGTRMIIRRTYKPTERNRVLAVKSDAATAGRSRGGGHRSRDRPHKMRMLTGCMDD
jgi:hypothetical protein